MHFELVQRFSAPVADVWEAFGEAAFIEPELLQRIARASTVGRPELLDWVDEGGAARRRIRYAFTGHLPSAARAVLDPARLTWVEESVLDRHTHRSEFRILPDHYPDRLRCAGTVTFAEEGGGTRRVTEADLRVTFPLVGSRVERAIVSGLRDHAAAEEKVVQQWLDERAGGG